MLRALKPHTDGERGFSMVELVVSVGILVVITSIVLVNHNLFGGNILVSNLAYDVGLSIRQAQVFGLSVREFGAGTGQFDIGYGIHFDSDDFSSYRLFADINKNKIFDAGDGTEEVFAIRQGFSIKQICATNSASVELCTGGDINTVDVVFIRPDPDAYIRVDGDPVVVYGHVRIIVQSPQGSEREIVVESTGQISISQN